MEWWVRVYIQNRRGIHTASKIAIWMMLNLAWTKTPYSTEREGGYQVSEMLLMIFNRTVDSADKKKSKTPSQRKVNKEKNRSTISQSNSACFIHIAVIFNPVESPQWWTRSELGGLSTSPWSSSWRGGGKSDDLAMLEGEKGDKRCICRSMACDHCIDRETEMRSRCPLFP